MAPEWPLSPGTWQGMLRSCILHCQQLLPLLCHRLFHLPRVSFLCRLVQAANPLTCFVVAGQDDADFDAPGLELAAKGVHEQAECCF